MIRWPARREGTGRGGPFSMSGWSWSRGSRSRKTGGRLLERALPHFSLRNDGWSQTGRYFVGGEISAGDLRPLNWRWLLAEITGVSRHRKRTDSRMRELPFSPSRTRHKGRRMSGL